MKLIYCATCQRDVTGKSYACAKIGHVLISTGSKPPAIKRLNKALKG